MRRSLRPRASGIKCLEDLGILANARGDSRRASRLFGLAGVVRNEAGTQSALFHLAEVNRELDLTQSRLDRTTFDAEWRAGQEMSVEEAIEFARGLSITGVPVAPATAEV